jgi:hypothetical protein
MRVPTRMELRELQECFHEIMDVIQFLDVGKRSNIDFKGRRLQNCGRSENVDDYVTRKELTELETRVKALENP